MTASVSPELKILLAHGDSAVSSFMRRDLQDLGYSITQVRSCDDALAQLHRHEFALGIIDARFPGGGLLCCEQIRGHNSSMPIILLMNQAGVHDRTACLDVGADDYILNPYQRETFLERIRLYLEPAQSLPQPQLEFEDLTLNLSNRLARRGDRSIDLTMKEFELLRFLMEHPREVLTRDQILENVWGFEYLGESNVIEVYIRYLRIKLEEGELKRLIHTVRGVGYVLREA
ncbi:MAG: response regulator transcription factor [Cyanobacteria bacterium P01_F01_bin.42]